ncbi:MAG TPA: hypothetical protein VFO39_01595 [Candidatus Sulfotelmatobacter sp.]|nr:hypothetical protein [Candidatus Sulfotelmatobacter sp.]
MRFAVDETLRGSLGTEATIETGNGGGDCGTPLESGGRFLIFSYKAKDGKLWTGMCNGNHRLDSGSADEEVLGKYRALIKKGTGSIFGTVTKVKPQWHDDDVEDSAPKSQQGVILHANSDKFHAVTTTAKDGSYEFNGLPDGKYTVIPEINSHFDFDHEDPDRYEADIASGSCQRVTFTLEPVTRIRGHVTLPRGVNVRSVEVSAVPTFLKQLNQFSGKWDFTDEDGRFDLWPLPPGDYYVGVNINSSPKVDSPFPPTYYPGVVSPKAATIVHLETGEVKDLELRLPELAQPRTVHFVAIGLDGKPLRAIYIQLEDLRHPGDASSYVNVDLDANGSGAVTIYSGYSYHLHGSHWVSYGHDWCAKPVLVPAGSDPVNVRFTMNREDVSCEISAIDKISK